MAATSGVKDDESGKQHRRSSISSPNTMIRPQNNKHSAVTQGIDTGDTISEVIPGDEKSYKDACSAASEILYVNRDISGQVVKLTVCGEQHQIFASEDRVGKIIVNDDKEPSDEEEYTLNNVLAKSRHRDGSIYRGLDTWWKRDYRIIDRNETRLEAMMFSKPTDCIIHNGSCMEHFPCRMLQILSLELAKIPVDGGLVELYGYIAVWDDLDPLLNYIVKFSRDDPIIVEQGSHINMAGPKRGIEMMDLALIEYDMRIKTGEQEKDDLQLIDGASIIGPSSIWNQPFTIHIPGSYGAVDITLSCLHCAVEATVEILGDCRNSHIGSAKQFQFVTQLFN